MSVVAPPPRPPDAPEPDPGAADAPEALIEEARDRARRRRRRVALVVTLLAVASLAALALLWQQDSTDAGTTGVGSRPVIASQPPIGTIALTRLGRGAPHVLVWTPHGLRETGIRGTAFGWSPDGTRLLVQRRGALYVVELASRRETLVARQGSGFNAAWSADGTRIAFEAGRAGPTPSDSSGWRKIVVVGADGRGARVLPGWALDGGLITGNLTWSPEGRDVVFAGRTTGSPLKGLFAVAADGRTPPRAITIPAAANPAQPTYAPDGSLLAFSDSGSGSIGDLVIVDSDGGNARRIEGGTGPVWSPDGTMLAYRTHGDSAWWTVRADGTHRTRLPPGSWAGLSWSPDSRFVAYAGGTGEAANDVFVVRPDGTGNRRIVRARGESVGLPLWRDGASTTESR